MSICVEKVLSGKKSLTIHGYATKITQGTQALTNGMHSVHKTNPTTNSFA